MKSERASIVRLLELATQLNIREDIQHWTQELAAFDDYHSEGNTK